MKIEINFTEKELENEIWKPIPYYENLYEASSLGRIRTSAKKKTIRNFKNKDGNWIKQERIWKQRILKAKYTPAKKNKKRYDGRVELWKNGEHKTFLVARLVIASFNKTYDLFGKMTVNHIDNNSLNNKIENLEWCSIADNIRKAFETDAYHYPKVKIIDKNNNNTYIFISKAKASIYIGQNKGYISYKTQQNIYENKKFKWEILS